MITAQLSVRSVSGFGGTSTRALSFYRFSSQDLRKMLVALLFLHEVSGLYASSSYQTSARCSIGPSYPSQLSSQHCSVPDALKDSAQSEIFPGAPDTNCDRALAERNQLRHEIARQKKDINKLRAAIHSVSQLLSIVVDQYEEELISPTLTVTTPIPDTTENSPTDAEQKRPGGQKTTEKRPREDQQHGEGGHRMENPKKRHREAEDYQLPSEEGEVRQPPTKRQKQNPVDFENKGRIFVDPS